jgi:alkanesulfonate monooxygenase SsuD/methylene tetrahydromethanopterin reductase-like flavin-dependent oxidoreductase (luciferase family)
MKFQLAINMERMDDSLDMREVARHTLEMVQMAEEGGFGIVWAAEHHALEMTIAPNPFSILTWHPIKLAGEAAFLDLISGGRLEFGIGSGAYQREFDRMAAGLKQTDAWQYMQEMLPCVQALWKGDHEHKGQFWSFPTATSCPKPLQKEVPIWVAARAPITYDYAVKQGCNIMSWPLTRGMDEAQTYMNRLNEAMAANPGKRRPTMAMMRHTAVYDRKDDWMKPVRAAQRQLSQFENLFKNLGDVANGFPKEIPLESVSNRAEYDPQMLSANLMFGTPDEVVAKLKPYQAMGVDDFIYYASMGYGLAEQKRSLELFCKHVIPAFR